MRPNYVPQVCLSSRSRYPLVVRTTTVCGAGPVDMQFFVFRAQQRAEPYRRTPLAQTEEVGLGIDATNYYLPTTVIVFLVKELNKNMLLFVQKENDVKIVCVDKR
eukprot:1176351-Prorocentrum_minimum.AAC.8